MSLPRARAAMWGRAFCPGPGPCGTQLPAGLPSPALPSPLPLPQAGLQHVGPRPWCCPDLCPLPAPHHSILPGQTRKPCCLPHTPKGSLQPPLGATSNTASVLPELGPGRPSADMLAPVPASPPGGPLPALLPSLLPRQEEGDRKASQEARCGGRLMGSPSSGPWHWSPQPHGVLSRQGPRGRMG